MSNAPTDTPNPTAVAQATGPLKRIVIDPLTRVEGHGKVTLLVDDQDQVQQARLHIVEFRGFEKFIQGRPFYEVPVLVQRLCGICPVSHHLAAAKAADQLVGVDELTPSAEKLRRLLHLGQVLQSHALHFFHLSSPDLLFGFDSDVAKRNLIGVAAEFPDSALMGIKLRKFGQQIIQAISGKRVHGNVAIPGGMNKSLSRQEIAHLATDIDTIVQWCKDAVTLSKTLFLSNTDFHQKLANFPSHYLSLVTEDGAFDLYHGGLRVKDSQGAITVDHFDYTQYQQLIREEVKSWSYLKFPYLSELGTEQGWYRVGPLARINNCDFLTTPLAEAARQDFMTFGAGQPVQASLAFHWARMIEALHCAEAIKALLQDPQLSGTHLLRQGEKRNHGVGVIEAPRGTLIHHYEIDENDLVTQANLIVSTTHNNQAMNEAVRCVAKEQLNGHKITPALLNTIEVAIRAYDPCLSCATHAVGKMPLIISLERLNGDVLHQLSRNSEGHVNEEKSSQ